MTTLREASEHLANREPFDTGTFHAEIRGGLYEVYSYFKVIAYASPDSTSDVATVLIGAHRLSKTTSRHANIVRKAWGL